MDYRLVVTPTDKLMTTFFTVINYYFLPQINRLNPIC